MKQTPLLFFGDSPSLQGGLGRIGRDLACLATTLPQFRVGYLGRGGNGSRQLPFVQYDFSEYDQWGENQIRRAWLDFAGSEQGIIFSIWDASRLLWFSRPEGIPPESGLREFLQSGRFARWGYFPVDAEGPNGRLTRMSRETLLGYDRVLAYGAWGSEVIERTIGRPVEWIPHGIDTNAFQPRDKKAARMAMGFANDDFVIGMVASNQARKDWGCAFATIANLRNVYPTLKFWAHVDVLERSHAWDIRALIADFGVADIVRVTMSGSLSDEQLSYWYSGSDITILPSSEGFGFSLVESMSCGTPVIHGKYAGGVELIPAQAWLVQPASWRLETIHNCVRPVYRPEDFVQHIIAVRDEGALYSKEYCRAAVDHLDWSRLFPSAWSKWLLEGIGGK